MVLGRHHSVPATLSPKLHSNCVCVHVHMPRPHLRALGPWYSSLHVISSFAPEFGWARLTGLRQQRRRQQTGALVTHALHLLGSPVVP